MALPSRADVPVYRLSVAPMMELTDRHFRYLMRLITKRTLLFTEMLTANAVIHGDRDRLLGHDATEHPLALQLGGSEPELLREAAVIGESLGYDEINMNVGCPSDRVKSGRFGACLMAEPELVAGCVEAMRTAVSIPVTVKCRVGIDRDDSYDLFEEFVRKVASGGCDRFYVHARKAWLDGLSPKENRTVPPLRYEYVYRLKETLRSLDISINGGIENWPDLTEHLNKVDGVMIGREAYYNPSFMLPADREVYGESQADVDKREVALEYGAYMQRQFESGVPMSLMCRHLVALYREVPGARSWRRHLSMHHRDYSTAEALVADALNHIDNPHGESLQVDSLPEAQVLKPGATG
ncbi:MAG: tRNA dihydrouridine(20/20a) synthase DusA [Granulosicoccus sp.]|nr:tRNA dihydrouridine(20/20a) synthase DusA [Granulosicoccus sp.]